MTEELNRLKKQETAGDAEKKVIDSKAGENTESEEGKVN
jgi:hypothetical protein